MGWHLIQYDVGGGNLDKAESKLLYPFAAAQLPSHSYPPSSVMLVSSVVKRVVKQLDYNYP